MSEKRRYYSEILKTDQISSIFKCNKTFDCDCDHRSWGPLEAILGENCGIMSLVVPYWTNKQNIGGGVYLIIGTRIPKIGVNIKNRNSNLLSLLSFETFLYGSVHRWEWFHPNNKNKISKTKTELKGGWQTFIMELILSGIFPIFSGIFLELIFIFFLNQNIK